MREKGRKSCGSLTVFVCGLLGEGRVFVREQREVRRDGERGMVVIGRGKELIWKQVVILRNRGFLGLSHQQKVKHKVE